ncbi:12894_t:CDS:2 [Rhizophagus irregularis]|nr:12894_t:CDS:2 [Rhizophagus irregularis]
MEIDQLDDSFREDTSVQGLKSGDSERSSEINPPSNQLNKETPLPNLGGRPKGDIWQFFAEINNGKGKHKGAICNFCNSSWNRGRANEMKSHLAMKCKGRVPKDIRLNFLREIDNERESSETSSISSSKKRKISNNQTTLENFYDDDKIDEVKSNRADKALIRWFVCSGIPFVAADSPYFDDFTKSLNSGYNPPKRTALATTHLDGELANVTLKIEKELAKAKNLTLCVDGWASPLKHSIYAFVIMTPERKQYIYSLEDVSSFSHTADFNARKMLEVLEKVGPEKFSAIITDAESAMMAAKRQVANKYPHILPMRCIAHHIQLISSDICNHPWAKKVLSDCQKIISFFKNSYPAGAALREEIFHTFTVGGNLKTSTKTRWSTAWDCLKKAVKDVEFQNTILADVFVELVKIAIAVQEIPTPLNNQFRKDSLEIWKQTGGGEKSAKILKTQMNLYRNQESPFDDDFIESVDTVKNWWSSCELKKNENHISILALKLHSITPHNASTERVFSVLNWYLCKRRNKMNISHLESLAQIHSFLIANAPGELNFINNNISQDEFTAAFNQIAVAMEEEISELIQLNVNQSGSINENQADINESRIEHGDKDFNIEDLLHDN